MKTKKTVVRKELLPVANKQRVVGPFGYFNMWVGIAVIIATFAVGGDGIRMMTLPWLVLACLLGNLTCGFFMTLTGDIGVEHGIPFSVYLRVPFGPIGSVIPSLMRGVLGCVWFGIQTWFGATAINYILTYFTGFDNWFVCFLLFTSAQVLNAALGIKAIERFANLAAPCIVAISVWIYYQVHVEAQAKGIAIWNSVLGGDGTIGNTFDLTLKVFVIVFFVNLSYWSTTSADSQNLTRYVKAPQNTKNWIKRNINVLSGHMVALPLVQTGIIIIGGASMLVLGNWNPIEALQVTASGSALIILLVLIVLAQWSTNISANLMMPAMTFLEAGKNHFGYPVACILVGVISVLVQPWSIMENLGGLLTIMSGVYSGIVGVTIVDYYILRKRRINVVDLYEKDCGQYKAKKGWNLAGLIALIVGLITANIFSDIAYLAGMLVSGVLYYVLAKFWWFKKHSFVEIDSNFSDDYLGTSVGHDWVISDAGTLEDQLPHDKEFA